MRRSKNTSGLILFIAIAVIAFLIYRAREGGNGGASEESTGVQRRLGPADIYPDAERTPGVANPDITQENIDETICNPRWSTKSIRPPAHYTNELKRQQIEEYDDSDTNPRDYEEDHLIPLEIGGSPTDPRNLWPEPYETSIADGGAHSKDKVENYLREEVCGGRIVLGEAQREIATDWYRVYVMDVPH